MTGPFKLPELPYAANSLEPYIDSKIMEIHHDKHHGGYVANLNSAIAGTEAENASIEDICRQVSKYPAVVRNNGGGHYNHAMLWTIMSPEGGGTPHGDLLNFINDSFGFFETFKKQFSEAGMNRFGSGWAWLIVDDSKRLVVCSTSNQDNPLMDVAPVKGFPILGMDVWEHAYYLKYQNRRADYITAFWNLINWDEVNRRLAMVME
ncbi:MAG: superoxide dismutase [Candidatus Omnitrophica bacterium]|nr:superoxide dismutase [Candidatus Omnitrophota bacterium]MDE2222243.1 superoxide dismutase [Candidatus Omnitrophota bacterium]